MKSGGAILISLTVDINVGPTKHENRLYIITNWLIRQVDMMIINMCACGSLAQVNTIGHK